MADLFWLSDARWAATGRFMPTNQPGARRVDDRRVISGIVHVLKSGGRRRDRPAAYGPRTTIHNRFNRWSRRGFRRAMPTALAEAGWVAETAALDSTYVKAHRSAHGGKEGHGVRRSGAKRTLRTARRANDEDSPPRRRPRPPGVVPLTPGNAGDVKTAPNVLAAAPGRMRRLIADRGCDADRLRRDLREAGTTGGAARTAGASRPRSVGSETSAALRQARRPLRLGRGARRRRRLLVLIGFRP